MDKNNIGSDHRGESDISGKRNSSLEFLRLLCIFMIICHHYFVHGGFRFEAFDLTIGDAIVQCAGMYGRAACSIFAMISGYFLISGHYHFRKFISILGTMTFYSVLVYSACSFLGIIHFSGTYFMNSFFPLFWFGNWYVQGYLLFFLFIPFVNRLLRTLNNNIINLTAAKVLPNRNFSIAFKGNRALFTLFGVNFSSFDRLLRHSKGTVQILFFLEQHLIIYR